VNIGKWLLIGKKPRINDQELPQDISL
jgi:hypothetical protein